MLRRERWYLIAFCTFTWMSFCGVPTKAANEQAPRPNVLLVMADDLGFSDLGCYGSEIATPNLDSLANRGIRYSQFYNTTRCWPTRGSLLTGYYAQQIRRDQLPGIPAGNRGVRPEWAPLLPALLKNVGYKTYHVGKWHIDGEPEDGGFDRSQLSKEAGRFFRPPGKAKSQDDSYYVTRAMADAAIDDLKNHAENHADKPFFHYLAFTAPHFPLHALPEDIAVYQDRYQDGWDVIRQQRWERLQAMGLFEDSSVRAISDVEEEVGPPYHFTEALKILGEGEINRPIPWKKLTDVQKKFQAKKMAIHAAMIHRMDIEIGRVLDQIRQMGQQENTLVMFLSDNGASAEIMVRGDGHDPSKPLGSAQTYLCLGPGWSTTCNTPFRRHKTWTHEGGISTPMIVSWPAGIEARNEVRREPHHVIDVVPTVLELAGATASKDAPPSPGRSFVSSFKQANDQNDRSFWWSHEDNKAMRQGDWKAVMADGESWQLYDLSTDRTETDDLATRHPEKLKQLIDAWNKQQAETIELASRDLR